MKPHQRHQSKGKPVRYIVAVLLASLAAYFMYEILVVSNTAGHLLELLTTCPTHPNSTLFKIYRNNPALSLSMFTMDVDMVSLDVKDHSSKEFTLGHQPTHQFYSKELCASTANPLTPRRCKGIVLDVGAFIGTHALVLAKLGYTVHAFEPQTHVTGLLRCSAAANGFNITVVENGVSNIVGKECFISPMSAAMHQAMTAPKLLTKLGCDNTSQINVVTLDHYWKTVLNRKQVAFIKVDAEGHEAYILEGGLEMFRTAPPPFMLVEYYPHMLSIKNVSTESLLNRIVGYGYRIYDCKKKMEVLPGPDGVRMLKPYTMAFSLTDLLLVHKAKAPRDLKGQYDCSY